MKNLSLADLIALDGRITDIMKELENDPNARDIFKDTGDYETLHYKFKRWRTLNATRKKVKEHIKVYLIRVDIDEELAHVISDGTL